MRPQTQEGTEWESALADGSRVLFRPITPEDKGRLRQGFERLSPESRYRRFFRHMDHLSEKDLRYLTEVDFVDHWSWLAVLPDEEGAPAVAVARWIRVADEPSVAEAAVTVADEYQAHGLGKTLLWLLALSAIENGIGSFRAWVLGENDMMLGLLYDAGAPKGKWESGVMQLDIPLPEHPDQLHETPAPLVLKAVAEGQFHATAGPEPGRGTTLMPPDP